MNQCALITGVRDSSGIRFRVTRHLRPYDSGIMELGLEYTNKMAIPPGQNAFTLPGYCIPECTSIVSQYRENMIFFIVIATTFQKKWPGESGRFYTIKTKVKRLNASVDLSFFPGSMLHMYIHALSFRPCLRVGSEFTLPSSILTWPGKKSSQNTSGPGSSFRNSTEITITVHTSRKSGPYLATCTCFQYNRSLFAL